MNKDKVGSAVVGIFTEKKFWSFVKTPVIA